LHLLKNIFPIPIIERRCTKLNTLQRLLKRLSNIFSGHLQVTGILKRWISSHDNDIFDHQCGVSAA
jgi:hypothetical protein